MSNSRLFFFAFAIITFSCLSCEQESDNLPAPAPEHCANGVKDADEEDIDCGGACGVVCDNDEPSNNVGGGTTTDPTTGTPTTGGGTSTGGGSTDPNTGGGTTTDPATGGGTTDPTTGGGTTTDPTTGNCDFSTLLPSGVYLDQNCNSGTGSLSFDLNSTTTFNSPDLILASLNQRPELNQQSFDFMISRSVQGDGVFMTIQDLDFNTATSTGWPINDTIYVDNRQNSNLNVIPNYLPDFTDNNNSIGPVTPQGKQDGYFIITSLNEATKTITGIFDFVVRDPFTNQITDRFSNGQFSIGYSLAIVPDFPTFPPNTGGSCSNPNAFGYSDDPSCNKGGGTMTYTRSDGLSYSADLFNNTMLLNGPSSGQKILNINTGNSTSTIGFNLGIIDNSSDEMFTTINDTIPVDAFGFSLPSFSPVEYPNYKSPLTFNQPSFGRDGDGYLIITSQDVNTNQLTGKFSYKLRDVLNDPDIILYTYDGEFDITYE